MRTLLVSEIFPPRNGGSGRWFWDMYRRLPRSRYILAVGDHPDQAAFDADAAGEMDIRRLPLHSDRWDLRDVGALRYYATMSHRIVQLVRGEAVGRLHCARCLPEGWLLQRRKGHDALIRALPAIRVRFPDVLYAIVGAGEEEQPLRDLVMESGLESNVQFLGEFPDEELVRCYQQCDVFVLPNRTLGRDLEGFGIVLLEAQACARPVIAGDSGGTCETLRAGETGWILDCTRPWLLAEGIVRLLSEPASGEAMGRAGRAWVLRTFDWPRVVPRVRAAFGEPEEAAVSTGATPATTFSVPAR